MEPLKQKAFSAVDLFSVLQPPELDTLAAAAVSRSYAPGQDLFNEGEPCTGLWVIAGGAVKIVKIAASGRQIVIAIQEAPATVAEVPVFDGGPYPATVTAIQSTQALLILKEDFHRICRRNPELTLRFLEVFGRRLRQLVTLVERVTFGNVRQRLAQMLIEFAGAARNDTFSLPVTHEELAARLGTVREVVSRNLGRFQAEGLVRVQRREIRILSREGLLAEAATEM
ncbi:MAG: Crp/Fnr family transcriptional regulator [Acidobacteria bacterium]|nr:Crp/Fnr family transcriptional regulator [Acidobacteriota bacterium]